MSEATRAVALTEAVKVASAAQTFDDVLTLAEQYHQFLVSDAAVPAGTKPAADKPAATKPTTTAKGATTKPTTTKPPAKSEEQTVADAAEAGAEDGPTEEQVGKAIADLLAANKRKEAVALLKKFGATSKSTLKPEHYADFLEEAALI